LEIGPLIATARSRDVAMVTDL